MLRKDAHRMFNLEYKQDVNKELEVSLAVATDIKENIRYQWEMLRLEICFWRE